MAHRGPFRGPAYDRLKRAIDILLALAGLILLSPVLALLAWRVRSELGPPVLFSQDRPGLEEQLFRLRKFRTMTDARGDDGELLPDEQRMTDFGRFLRSTSLDELPELWNVLRGEMSLVGPRPLLAEYLGHYSDEQARRHEVRPGMTGWSQINGRNNMSWADKLALDVWYVDYRSLWLDIRILLRTLWVIVRREGVSLEGHATTVKFTESGESVGTPSDSEGPLSSRPMIEDRNRCQADRHRTPKLIHLTTVDMSLSYLLLPQLLAFREAGYEVIGVSAPGHHVQTLADHGIRHIPLERSTRAADLRADAATAREFVEVCRSLRPDIVHTHNPKPGVYGRFGASLARTPVVVNTVHGLYAQPTDSFAKRAVVYGLERLAATCSDAELLQNPEDLPVLRRLGVPARKLHLLGNGVDLRRFDPEAHADARVQVRAELEVGEDAVLVGLVGRLVAEKGYREVFEAARRLRHTRSKVRFVVIGPADPDKTDAITRAELDRAEADGVKFLGMRSDVERLYPAMDLYVLASHREGFPRSAMEAAAMELPLITTDIRGCRQVVDDGKNGHLVPVGDPSRLTAAIADLVDNPARRKAMAKASHEKALREFDDRRQIEITLEVYERLLAERRRR